MMVPILACSVLSIAIIVERLSRLRRSSVLPSPLVGAIHTPGRLDEKTVIAEARRYPSPLGEVVLRAIEVRHFPWGPLEEAVAASGQRQSRLLERNLIGLEVIAGVAPLLGLLGTVLGMADIFSEISAGHLGQPGALARGISEALVTTVAGLFTAIPALVAYSLFSKRLDDLVTEMEHHAAYLLQRLRGAGEAEEQRAAAEGEPQLREP